MANLVKGEVPLSLSDGRNLRMVMDFDMRVAVETLTDKPFHVVAQRASEGFQGDVRALMWGALQRFHADLSMGDVTTLIEEEGPALEAALVRAGEAATPPESAEGNVPAAGKPARRGRTSGASGAKPG